MICFPVSRDKRVHMVSLSLNKTLALRLLHRLNLFEFVSLELPDKSATLSSYPLQMETFSARIR